MLQSELLLVLGTVAWTVQGELYSAISDLEALLKSEETAVDIVHRYLKSEYSRLDAVKRFAQDQAAHNDHMRLNGTSVSEPLNLFLSTKRLYWVQNLIKKNNADSYLKGIAQHRTHPRASLPTEHDAIGAALALFRLQDTYKLDTKDIADGLIGGDRSSRPLTALECYELGKVAYEMEDSDFYHTLLWMQEADRRLSTEKMPTVKREEILDYLSYAMYEQGNVERALILSKQLRRLNPGRNLINENIEYYETTLKQQKVAVSSLSESNLPKVKLHRDMSIYAPWFPQYEAVCRGEKSLSRKLKSQLTCYYKQNRPFLRLARIKVQVMHLKPKVLLLKDVVSDAESEIIQRLAGPKIDRAGIVRASGNFERSEKRTSKIAWFQDEDHALIRRLSKRVEDMTDLSCDTAEYLQVANYGIGGHYEPHFDAAPKGEGTPGEQKTFDNWGAGNRIATVLFYLSQPVGGATVFQDLSLTLQPSKNDAVFWHNLYKSGVGDGNTRHAACPVLSGVKWVANKWLHEYGQEFLRPCSLDEYEYE